jgi:hypothetical protein
MENTGVGPAEVRVFLSVSESTSWDVDYDFHRRRGIFHGESIIMEVGLITAKGGEEGIEECCVSEVT